MDGDPKDRVHLTVEISTFIQRGQAASFPLRYAQRCFKILGTLLADHCAPFNLSLDAICFMRDSTCPEPMDRPSSCQLPCKTWGAMAQQRTTFTCWWSTRRRFPSPQLVNHLKGVSSRMLRKQFPDLAARGAQLWTPSYFGCCVVAGRHTRVNSGSAEPPAEPGRAVSNLTARRDPAPRLPRAPRRQ